MQQIGLTVEEIADDSGPRVLSLQGDLDLESIGVVARALSTALVDVGGVVVDVSGLRVTWLPAVQVFPSTLALLGGWPQARMVLCGADPELQELLSELTVTAAVPSVGDEHAAHARLLRPPSTIARCHDLPPDRESPRRSRALVRTACREWGVPDIADDAVLVASELVTNVVEHARTTSRLTLTLDEHGFTVAVRDDCPGTLRRLRVVDPLARDGRGLLVVANAGRSWGVTDHGYGKTVWATVAAPPPPGSDPAG
jgi:anti-sigma regulatory factor (Ser/Thr protein kinase)